MFLPECGAMVIAEPTANYPYLGHRGALWLEGTLTGRTAHGSMPELGENAVYKGRACRHQARGFWL